MKQFVNVMLREKDLFGVAGPMLTDSCLNCTLWCLSSVAVVGCVCGYGGSSTLLAD